MLAVYLLLVGLGVVLSVALRRRGARTWPGVLGTVLAVLSVLSGFSIGPLLAAASAVVMIVAAVTGLRPRNRPGRDA